MKDLVKVEATGGQAISLQQLKALAIHVLVGICAFFASRAIISGNIVPFGIVMVASAPLYLTPAASIGAFIGYFIPAINSGGFRYIAAILAVLAIKYILGNHKKVVANPLFLSLLCFICTAVTGFVAFGGISVNPLKLLVESLVCAGSTYFFIITFSALGRDYIGLSGDELSALLISINILLIGIEKLNISGISIGRILGTLLILICAKYGGTLSGAISGIAFSFSTLLTGLDPTASAIYALIGLITGIFAAYGKYIQITSALISSFVCILIYPLNINSMSKLIEIISGCVLFVLLPRSAGIVFGKLFCIRPQIITSNGLKKAVTMRLNLAANALSDVSETVEQVSKELSRINAPDFSSVISSIEQDTCSGCKLRLHCWENRKSSTVEAVLSITKAVKSGDQSPENAAAPEFRGRCLRLQRLGNSVYRNYSSFASKTAAENRIEEVRQVVSDQFNGISSMLSDLSFDIQREEKFDHSTAVKATQALKNLNIHADESSCSIDKFGRMTLKLKIKRNEDLIINKRNVMKIVSLACDRDFDIPNVSEVGGNVFITLSERAVYRVQIGVHQLSAGSNSMCGDAYQYFNDGQGHFLIILSDGMGTGGRAAVDGAMASGLMARLLKAGFGYDCSLRILNSSMLFKSTDESMSTVDITSIDLYTGETVLHKAGAAPTLVRRSGRTGKAESSSLPVGILREIGFDKASIKLKSGDILVMMSDGAVSEGTDWIRNELEEWQDGDAEQLAEHICKSANRRRSDNHEDDITVIAAIINRAI